MNTDATKEHDEVTDVESVSVYDPDAEQLTIFAVNRTLEKDVEFSVDIRSFGDYKVLEHIVLENDDLKAVNSSVQEKVKPSVSNQSKIDAGQLTSLLHAASWNVIRLGKN